MKKCKRCNIEYELFNFTPSPRMKDGLSSICKRCESERAKLNSEKNKLRNLTSVKPTSKICKGCHLDTPISDFGVRSRNIDGFDLYCKPCRASILRAEYIKYRDNMLKKAARNQFKHRDEILVKKKQKREENKDKLREDRRVYKNKKYHSDPVYKLKWLSQTAINKAFKKIQTKKPQSTSSLIGTTFGNLKTHIESMLSEGMTWDNYGTIWHVDHITPLATASTTEKLVELFHYTNLQPLFKIDNIKKSSYVDRDGKIFRAVKGELIFMKHLNP